MKKNDSYAFISYSSSNRNEARRIYEVLTSSTHKVTCWLDIEELKKKKEGFPEQLRQAIQNASCLIYVETEQAQESKYVDLELKTALEFDIPIIHYPVKADKSDFWASVRMFLLALRVKFRITQPFWVSLAVLGIALGIMALAIFFFGKMITPVLAEATDRVFSSSINGDSEAEAEVSPELVAPFAFFPHYAFLLDDFSNQDNLDSDYYYYDISNDRIDLVPRDGIAHLVLPENCAQETENYSCELEIHSQTYPLEDIHYFAFRARIDSVAPNQSFTLSISPSSWERSRIGFGWSLSGKATAYFKAFQALPEEDYYADVVVDDQWHAYEVLLDPNQGELSFYTDGQLIGTHTIQHYEEWKNAPLHLIMFATRSGNYQIDNSEIVETRIELDKIIIGGFNPAE